MVSEQPIFAYRNAMETLVAQELQRQLRMMPPKVAQEIAIDDVAAYALNCLPPLYATTDSGWEWQVARAQEEMQSQIAMAVSQGLMVVHQAPIRSGVRISAGNENLISAQKALQELARILNRPNLSWQEVVSWVKQARLQRSARVSAGTMSSSGDISPSSISSSNVN
jgi:Late competence development protein ComFB